MSHVAPPRPRVARGLVLLAALLALLATAAVVLVLAIDRDPAPSALATQAVSAARADGGPEESAVAAAVGSRTRSVAPDESKIAATIGSGREASRSLTLTRPDESRVAAAVAGR